MLKRNQTLIKERNKVKSKILFSITRSRDYLVVRYPTNIFYVFIRFFKMNTRFLLKLLSFRRSILTYFVLFLNTISPLIMIMYI